MGHARSFFSVWNFGFRGRFDPLRFKEQKGFRVKYEPLGIFSITVLQNTKLTKKCTLSCFFFSFFFGYKHIHIHYTIYTTLSLSSFFLFLCIYFEKTRIDQRSKHAHEFFTHCINIHVDKSLICCCVYLVSTFNTVEERDFD